ncbi:MAG: hypothetical protein HYY22_07760 [Thaumarchaeota archaeon]|nr:hypothetical protein [Nitrososphaerota archaeon]
MSYYIENNLRIVGLDPPSEISLRQVMALVEPLLAYLPRGIPGYTDHGVIHSRNLLNLLVRFIENFGTSAVSSDEKFVLCLAIWLHDIGCLIDRKDHAQSSVKLLEHPRFNFLESMIGKDKLHCLKYVIKSHSSHYDLEELPNEQICNNVNLRKVCVIFRLLDECDISYARANPVLFEILRDNGLLSESNLPHWEAHRSVIDVAFVGTDIILACEKKSLAKVLIKHFEKEVHKLDKILSHEGFGHLEVKIVELPDT